MISRTKDWALIREIMTHPKIWPWVGDDFAPAPEEWQPNQNDEVFYLLATDGTEEKKEVLGLFVFYPENRVLWHSHVAMLPSAWGERAQRACLEAFQWLWANSSCERIMGAIPDCNPTAIAFAVKCGMRSFGINPHSYRKFGKLHHLILLGVSKARAAEEIPARMAV